MSDFNYIEYLKNNPLKGTKTQSSKLITEAQETLKAKMTKSQLKEKIREEILSALNEETAPINKLKQKMPNHVKSWAKYVAQHEDGEWWFYDDTPKLVPGVGWKSYDSDGYQWSSDVKTNSKNWEKSSQKLNENRWRDIKNEDAPAQGLSAEEMMGDIEDIGDIRAMLDKERFKPMKFDDPKLDQEYAEYLATNDYDGPLEERKDEEEAPAEEEMDAEVNVDVEAAPAQGLSAEEQEIQNSLKIAYDSAAAIGDQKLADQIGNSITFFTRTHVVER